MTTQRLNIHFLTVWFNETSDYFMDYDYRFYPTRHVENKNTGVQKLFFERTFRKEIPYFNLINMMTDILSNKHTARVPLVYVLRDLLNKHKEPLQKDWKEEWEEDWKVEIKDDGALVLNNGSKNYLFGECKEKDHNRNISGYLLAVSESFKESQTVEFYKLA